jgi:peptidoglycan/LPS O-acetylase OafA/YrhL
MPGLTPLTDDKLLLEPDDRQSDADPTPNVVTPIPSTPKIHLAYLDGVRALAAIYVMLGHAALQIWPVYTSERRPTGFDRYLFQTFSYAHYAVTVFIVLSGFCLMLPVVRNNGVLRGGAAEFFRRRARRILPPYYFALGLSLLLIYLAVGQKTGTHWDSSLPVTNPAIAAHVLLVQDIYGAPKINHVFWSIAVECQIYLFFPLLVMLWKRFNAFVVTAAAVVVAIAAVIALRKVSFAYLPPQYFGLFVVGMLGAALSFGTEERFASLRKRVPWSALAIGLAITAVAAIALKRAWQADCLVAFATVAFLVNASRPESFAARALSLKPIAFIGLFAYSVYLIHGPLLQIAWQLLVQPFHLGDRTAFAVLALVVGPLIVGAAYLFYLAFERPFLNKRAS